MGRERFIEKVGLLFEADSAPRISGRIFGFLLLTPDECSLDELAEALHVSKASISTNARLLGRWGVVERVTRPGDRRDFYRIADDLHVQMLARRLERMQHVRAVIAEGACEAAPKHPRVLRRLRDLNQAHLQVITSMKQNLQRLRTTDHSYRRENAAEER